MKITLKLILFGILIGTISCRASKKTIQNSPSVSELKVAFYNIENLFDLEDDPNKFDEDFTPTGKLKWNQERYLKKLSNIAYVISQLGGDNTAPDIVGLCEVENAAVLKDLVRQHAIKSRDYQFIHYDSPDERGIDVALLYDARVFQPFHRQAIRIKLPGKDSTTRDVLFVKGKIGGKDTLSLFVNHWPSRRNPEEMRLITARKVRAVVDSLLNKNINERILLMGDLNDEPDNQSLQILTQKNSDQPARTLINGMTELKKQGLGTHEYRKEWNMLDQFVYSAIFQTGKWRVADGFPQVFKPDFLQEQDPKYKGSPYRTYVGDKYLGGYSDHFPIQIRFKYQR
jgi:endonuclease/exonuclease/phosphatase family metal-dependent hydrolase